MHIYDWNTKGDDTLFFSHQTATRTTTMAVVLILLLFLVEGLAADLSAGQEPEVIGESVEGREIRSYALGTGDTDIILIGGIHGGYEWNTVQLARMMLEHFAENGGQIPDNYRLHIIPNMNPDGLHRITEGADIDTTDFSSLNTTPGRFNARGVDLNRNWDAQWKPTSYWGQTEVDAGSEPFSEPETRAARDFILERDPAVVIFFQSAANGIWFGGKREGNEPARRLAAAYAEASGYDLPDGSDGPVNYEITGAASSYLYRQGIRALTIELETHSQPEFDRNISGVRAVFERLDEQEQEQNN
ncbi:MAG: M14 family metallopeptidase [Spirochaetota bacterium]